MVIVGNKASVAERRAAASDTVGQRVLIRARETKIDSLGPDDSLDIPRRALIA